MKSSFLWWLVWLAPAVAGVTNGEVYRDPAASADLVADRRLPDESGT